MPFVAPPLAHSRFSAHSAESIKAIVHARLRQPGSSRPRSVLRSSCSDFHIFGGGRSPHSPLVLVSAADHRHVGDQGRHRRPLRKVLPRPRTASTASCPPPLTPPLTTHSTTHLFYSWVVLGQPWGFVRSVLGPLFVLTRARPAAARSPSSSWGWATPTSAAWRCSTETTAPCAPTPRAGSRRSAPLGPGRLSRGPSPGRPTLYPLLSFDAPARVGVVQNQGCSNRESRESRGAKFGAIRTTLLRASFSVKAEPGLSNPCFLDRFPPAPPPPTSFPLFAAQHRRLCALQQVQARSAAPGPGGAEAAAWPAHFVHDVQRWVP